MGLAYEIVINSDPCISYLMEENTMTMQALVIAHACYGHNSFFKGNYMFRSCQGLWDLDSDEVTEEAAQSICKDEGFPGGVCGTRRMPGGWCVRSGHWPLLRSTAVQRDRL